MSSGWRCPCTRTCGGELVEMCRSLPFISNIFFSRSLKVAFIGSSVQTASSIAFLSDMQVLPSSRDCTLVHGFTRNFFQSCHAVYHFSQSTATECDHSPINGFLLQLHGRRTDKNQFPDVIIDLHYFVKTSAAFIAAVVTRGTTFALRHFYGLRLLWSKSGVEQRLMVHINMFAAVAADAPNQTLGDYEVHSRSH